MAEIEEQFNAVMIDDGSHWVPKPEVSGFTRPDWPLLCSDNPENLQWARWGLVPSWVKDQSRADELALKTLNARAESLREKPSFRDSIKKRCLVPVTGFFEPHHRGGQVYPFLFSHPEGQLFSLGAIFQDSPYSGKKTKRSFSIITVEADEETARIHNRKKRMPLLVPPEWREAWLNSEKEPEQWKEILQHKANLRYWPVSRQIYKAGHHRGDENLLLPVEIPDEELDIQQELF